MAKRQSWPDGNLEAQAEFLRGDAEVAMPPSEVEQLEPRAPGGWHWRVGAVALGVWLAGTQLSGFAAYAHGAGASMHANASGVKSTNASVDASRGGYLRIVPLSQSPVLSPGGCD